MNKLTKGSNLRWESSRIMLPEHKEELIKLGKDKEKVPKPILDEQELEQINIDIYNSLNYTMPMRLTLWDGGYFKDIEGVVDKIDYVTKTLLIDTDKEILRLSINDISKTEMI
ncbi:YolD-like family protein [Robertmurraya siralis]|uniref:YolD-like family protein n=1 Tax=Robertmurraya siralis TaxID=77777 RepID=UPI0010F6D894|nr:YolD-like family protein [Robertmurraya siralis]